MYGFVTVRIMNKMFCSSCGKEIKDEAAFCAHCGAPVSGKSGEKKESEKLNARIEKVGFMEYIISCFRNYANFDGRARRRELWFLYLFYFICYAGSAAINETFRTIVILVFFLPLTAVNSRRLHDVGDSGWMQLIPIYNIVRYCTDSEPSDNKYGPKVK